MVTYNYGAIGSNDFVTDQKPGAFREMILRLYPNGSAPLTALSDVGGSEVTTDPQFNWWTDNLPAQGGAVTAGDVKTTANLVTAYTSGGVAGDTLYVKCAEAVASQFRVGHLALLRCSTDLSMDVRAKVTGVQRAGALSYVQVKLLEADDNSTASKDLSDANLIYVIGNINAENATIPDSWQRQPVKFSNYTQIFRTPLELSRTARLTKLRTGDAMMKAKMEAGEIHSIEMEEAFWWGIATENVGSNGKPERTTQGVVDFIKTNASGNVFKFDSDTTYSGMSWLAAGDTWIDTCLSTVFRYGGMSRIGFCGNKVLLGIQRLAKALGTINVTPTTNEWGMKVLRWVTNQGVVDLRPHPLFNRRDSNLDILVLMEPENVKYRFISDTFYKTDNSEKQNINNSKDGTNEEFLTEAGLEFHFPETFAMMSGFNSDSAV